MAASGVKSVSFEVFGKVQGVFFRKAQAKKLGLSGWVKNDPSGSVVGCVEGPEDKIKVMKKWLEETGSPECRIEKCVFSQENTVDKPAFNTFEIRH